MIQDQSAANMVRGKTTGVNRRKVNKSLYELSEPQYDKTNLHEKKKT